MKKYMIVLAILGTIIPAKAFEDCIITNDGKLTDIRIQNNEIIDVYPLVTIDNDKSTLIVQPLKTGETKFTVLKNKKDKYLFSVAVTEDKTTIEAADGFSILAIDTPPNLYEEYFDIDEPPAYLDKTDTRNMTEEAIRYQNYIDNLEEPPRLRSKD